MTHVRLAVVACCCLVAVPPAASAATTLGGRAGAKGATPLTCSPTFATDNACTAVQQQLAGKDRAARTAGIITSWRAGGSGKGAIFIADLNEDGTFKRIATSKRASLRGPRKLTRIPIAKGQYVGLGITPGSAFASKEEIRSLAFVFGDIPSRVAMGYEATLEPDRDKDGYGDDTQDAPPVFTVRPRVRTVLQGKPSNLRFSLSQAAKLRIVLERGSPARRRTIPRLAAKAGRNTLSLGKLLPGRYRATIVATDAAGTRSKRVTIRFTVVARDHS